MIGEEICDLDAAVSTIALAYYYSRSDQGEGKQYIPVLNINQNNLWLKGELAYILEPSILDAVLTMLD